MARKKPITRKKAPARRATRQTSPKRRAAPRIQAIGGPLIVGNSVIPLSKAVRAGDYVFLSGQVPFKDGVPMTIGTIEEQTQVTMELIKATLNDAGCNLSDVVKVTVWLKDKTDFLGFNRVYATYFPDRPPARSTIQSPLMVDVRIEIEMLAYKPR